MSHPATQAHYRLIESGQLPVRTIRRERDGPGSGNGGHGGLSHRIEYRGVVYESKNDARRALRCGGKKIDEMLASGEAKCL